MAGSFANQLLRWYPEHARELPWVGEKDPYRVWLSEIILQQTRVEQGLNYYLRFIDTFPDVQSLATAPETLVMKLWEGLGYYSRARNMHATAKLIAHDLNGVFPDTLEGLTALKGIGPYTARAILSYAFHKPYAVADGNVFRILSRVYGIATPVNTPAGKSELEQLAQKLVDKSQSHVYNQAMMDLGATICKPRNPVCQLCPLANRCHAKKQGVQDAFPVKTAKAARRRRYFHFFIVRSKSDVFIQQRPAGDIWQQLWQFPVVETGSASTLSQVLQLASAKAYGLQDLKFNRVDMQKQILTHQELHCSFYVLDKPVVKTKKLPGCIQVRIEKLNQYAFPGAIRSFLKRNTYF
ncbi:MAG TPA: A/G-specific adenine glycosylase [Chitinophagales bacterium]|nr:A/G-specific adenine glycosylase [Chitinophagales bacterium]